MKKVYLLLLTIAMVFAACEEKNNIPSPGTNDYNEAGPGMDAMAVDDDAALLAQMAAEGKNLTTIKEAIKLGKALPSGGITPETYYIKGVVKSVPTWGARDGKNHATFYMADSPYALDQFYCYQVYDKGGNGWEEQGWGILPGNVIVLECKIKNYGGTIENDYDAFVCATTWTAPTIETTGDGSYAHPYTVADVLALNNKQKGNCYVSAYIVGAVKDESLAASAAGNMEFVAPFSKATNLLLADAAGQTDASQVMTVTLPNRRGEFGDITTALNLSANPDMLGKQVLLYGSLEKIFGLPGMSDLRYAECDGNTYHDKL